MSDQEQSSIVDVDEQSSNAESETNTCTRYWTQIANEAEEVAKTMKKDKVDDEDIPEEETVEPTEKPKEEVDVQEELPVDEDALEYWKNLSQEKQDEVIEKEDSKEENLEETQEDDYNEKTSINSDNLDKKSEQNNEEDEEEVEEDSSETPPIAAARSRFEVQTQSDSISEAASSVAKDDNDETESIVSEDFMQKRLTRLYSREKSYTNEEVLNQIASETQDEEDQNTVNRMLLWAKSSRKPKTETFVVRAKKRDEGLRKAIDFGAMNIVIEDKNSKNEDGLKTIETGSSRFQVTETDTSNKFQVRKTSLIKPASENIVTEEWVENAIKTYEQENDVEVTNMKFEPKNTGGFEAFIAARIGNRMTREYHWIIKKTPQTGVQYNAKDKDTFMVADLGAKIGRFVASKKFRKPMTVPFAPVIYVDNQYAIFENISNFKNCSGQDLNTEHMKLALKALAKMHAMSYAFFNKGSVDVKDFSEVLKLMIDKRYQPSATFEDRQIATENLLKGFRKVLATVSTLDKQGAKIAQEAKLRMENRLYEICKNACASTSNFSVLCHGFPTDKSFRFLYNEKTQKPIEAKIIGFQGARYAHAATDVQLLFATSTDPKVQEQKEFLLRYFYFEGLTYVLKMLGVASDTLSFDDFLKDFNKMETYGSLMGAIHLCGGETPTTSSGSFNIVRRATGKRVFESKIAGKLNNSSPQEVSKEIPKEDKVETNPTHRAKDLLMNALLSMK